MTDAWGTVTGVIDGGGRPDTVNVNTGGPDGIDAIWDRPGSLRAGDTVVLEKIGAVWLVKACTSRKILPPDIGSIIDFMTAQPPDGKQISTWWRRDASTPDRPRLTAVYADGSPPVVPVGQNSQPFTATGGGTWDEVNNWRAGTVRQGVYPGFPHQAFGLWFMPSTIAAALADQTIAHCEATTTRVRGMGSGGPVPGGLQLYSHTYTSPPTGQPSMVFAGPVPDAPQGAQAAFTVPIDVARGLAAGTVAGLGITAPTEAQYCGYLPDLTLTFYY